MPNENRGLMSRLRRAAFARGYGSPRASARQAAPNNRPLRFRTTGFFDNCFRLHFPRIAALFLRKVKKWVGSSGHVAQMFCCSHGAASPCFGEIRRAWRASTQRGGYSGEFQAEPLGNTPSRSSFRRFTKSTGLTVETCAREPPNSNLQTPEKRQTSFSAAAFSLTKLQRSKKWDETSSSLQAQE